jgi:putative DNA methylase
MTYRKKLIEVALPLDAISEASVREKSIRHGHPSTLHLWWSRKPLAASRAVIFASLVDDPSEHTEQFPTEQEQDIERTRLFKLIQELVKWENINNEDILRQAHTEILKSAPDGKLPPFLDPFAGGGSIPLEAQRLGLETYASDLNPVAVLLNKALIEIPPKFADLPPVNANAKDSLLQREWQGAQGLADDVRYYGKWMRDEAEQRIGYLYPKVKLSKEYGEAIVIAWLWVHTVTCPNPACGAQMPLASKWWLSKKKGKEVWIEPQIDQITMKIDFVIKSGSPDTAHLKDIDRGTSFADEKGKKTKATFECIVCNTGIAKGEYIDAQANIGKMAYIPIAIVAEGKKGRQYLKVDSGQMHTALDQSIQLLLTPHIQKMLPKEPAKGTFASNAQGRIYGFKTFSDYFTERQLIALITFIDLLQEAKEKIVYDAAINDDFIQCVASKDNVNADDYAKAIITYLALSIDRLADRNSTICSWDVSRDSTRNTFARQAIPMTWDFAEANPFSDSTGNFFGAVDWVAEVVENSSHAISGHAMQRDAASSINDIPSPIISTDPPYYDNVSYADLSDFFYVWLRRSLNSVYPELFGTMLVPKAQELIATPYRFEGSKQKAQEFFEHGLSQAFERMRAVHHPDYPLTIYYAFKQAEDDVSENENGDKNGKGTQVASTGWETMLEGLIHAGFAITGTWPMRTEMMNRSVGQGTNALASSIILVCRPRPVDAPTTSRRQFINELRASALGWRSIRVIAKSLSPMVRRLPSALHCS